MYDHTTWPPPCGGTTGVGTGAVPAHTGRWHR